MKVRFIEHKRDYRTCKICKLLKSANTILIQKEKKNEIYLCHRCFDSTLQVIETKLANQEINKGVIQ